MYEPIALMAGTVITMTILFGLAFILRWIWQGVCDWYDELERGGW